MPEEIFCGIGPVPKNKRRGTAKQCLDAKQVRYYGKHKIDPKLLEKVVVHVINFEKEKAKLRKLEYEAKAFIRSFQALKIEHDEKPHLKTLQKKMKAALAKRTKLVNGIKKQSEKVLKLQQEEDDLRANKAEKRQKRFADNIIKGLKRIKKFK
jgi:hypothetical protein